MGWGGEIGARNRANGATHPLLPTCYKPINPSAISITTCSKPTPAAWRQQTRCLHIDYTMTKMNVTEEKKFNKILITTEINFYPQKVIILITRLFWKCVFGNKIILKCKQKKKIINILKHISLYITQICIHSRSRGNSPNVRFTFFPRKKESDCQSTRKD